MHASDHAHMLCQMMDKYLAVKKIKAPRDEVHFVVDRVHHTLAPELMPDDLALEGESWRGWGRMMNSDV